MCENYTIFFACALGRAYIVQGHALAKVLSSNSLKLKEFSISVALEFIDTFFTTMAREWHGIDRLRLDKFYMVCSMYIGCDNGWSLPVMTNY